MRLHIAPDGPDELFDFRDVLTVSKQTFVISTWIVETGTHPSDLEVDLFMSLKTWMLLEDRQREKRVPYHLLGGRSTAVSLSLLGRATHNDSQHHLMHATLVDTSAAGPVWTGHHTWGKTCGPWSVHHARS